MKRVFDFLASFLLLLVFLMPFVVIAIAVKLTSKGKVLYWSDRVGKDNVIYKMPKFRTMNEDTPEIATHLLTDSTNVLTPIGGFLRRYSLDEIPQLWNIFIGSMSFVGPRPALYNQDDLISLRSSQGIDKILPGLTGWAQVNGRDNLVIKEKVSKDLDYLKHRSFLFDLKILWLTIIKVIHKDGVSH